MAGGTDSSVSPLLPAQDASGLAESRPPRVAARRDNISPSVAYPACRLPCLHPPHHSPGFSTGSPQPLHPRGNDRNSSYGSSRKILSGLAKNQSANDSPARGLLRAARRSCFAAARCVPSAAALLLGTVRSYRAHRDRAARCPRSRPVMPPLRSRSHPSTPHRLSSQTA
jgi:hypothetical protein